MNLPRIRDPLFAAALAALAGVPLAAIAQSPPPPTDMSNVDKAPEWSRSDTDRDGFLSREELIPFPGVLKKFNEIDSDGDNRISEAEYAAWRDRR